MYDAKTRQRRERNCKVIIKVKEVILNQKKSR